MKEKISVVVDKELWVEFKEYCKKHGFSMSNKIEVLIRHELDHKNRREKRQQEVMEIIAELVDEKKSTKKDDNEKTVKPAGKDVTDLKSLTDRYFEKKKSRIVKK